MWWQTSILLASALFLRVCLAQAPFIDENPVELISNMIPVIHDPYEHQFQQQQQQLQFQQQSSNAGAGPGPASAAPNYDEFPDDYVTGTGGPSSGNNLIPNDKTNINVGRGPMTRRGGRKFGGGDLSMSMPRSDNRNRYMDDLLLPARSNKCDRRIRVINGATRIRDKGALVRFQCSYGFHMLGVSVAVCVRGQWSDPPPTCVRDGCKKLPIPLQGSLRQLYGGGVAVFSCNYGYELEGQRILTCDGQKWNGSAPVCKEIPPITIAPPSTTFPTLPELFTTEATNTNVGLEKNPNAGSDSSTLPSPRQMIDADADAGTDNAQSHGQPLPDAEDPDLVLVPPSTPSEDSQSTERRDDDRSASDGKETSITSNTTTNTPDRPDVPPSADFDPMDPVLPVQATTLATAAVDVAPWPGPAASASMPQSVTSSTGTTASTVSKAVTSASASAAISTLSTRKLPLAPGDKVTTLTPIPVTQSPAANTPTLSTTSTASTSRRSASKWTTTPWWMRSRPPSPTPTKPVKQLTTTRLPVPAPADQSPIPYNYNPVSVPHLMSPLTVSPPRFELVPAINPEKFGEPDSDPAAATSGDQGARARAQGGHVLVTVGVVLIAFGALTMAGGIATYYWRRNVGIARARSHDIDGRTLNMSQGSNEDVVWSENRDSGL